jgi:hypothetical protein
MDLLAGARHLLHQRQETVAYLAVLGKEARAEDAALARLLIEHR